MNNKNENENEEGVIIVWSQKWANDEFKWYYTLMKQKIQYTMWQIQYKSTQDNAVHSKLLHQNQIKCSNTIIKSITFFW